MTTRLQRRKQRKLVAAGVAAFIVAVVAYWAYMRTGQANTLGDQLAAHFKQIGLGIWHVLTTVVTIIVDAFQYL